MDTESRALSQVEQKAEGKKAWCAPQVVRQVLTDAEATGHLSADFSVAS